jgi:hypothetical protein
LREVARDLDEDILQVNDLLAVNQGTTNGAWFAIQQLRDFLVG